MIKPGLPFNEKLRQRALDRYEVLDSENEPRYDFIVRMAKMISDVPMVAVSLVDRNRQWFKATEGLNVKQTPREVSFCGHAILRPGEILVVEDATKDERFHDNPLVTGAPGVRFYAGKPLVNDVGLALGTLCIIDTKPRKMTPKIAEALENLAGQVMHHLDNRLMEVTLRDCNRSSMAMTMFM